MHYALFSLFGFVVSGGFGAGQADLVRRAITLTKKAGKTQAGQLRSAGAIHHCMVNTRPGRAPQGHAWVAG